MKKRKLSYKELSNEIKKEWEIYKPYHSDVFKLTGGSKYVDPKSPLAFEESNVFETKVNEYIYKINQSKQVNKKSLKLLNELKTYTNIIKQTKSKNISERIANVVLRQYTSKWLKEYLKLANGKITGVTDKEFVSFLTEHNLFSNKDFWTAFRMSGHKYFQPMTNWENYKKIDYSASKKQHLIDYQGEKYGGNTWYNERVMAFYYEVWTNENFSDIVGDENSKNINWSTIQQLKERVEILYGSKQTKKKK